MLKLFISKNFMIECCWTHNTGKRLNKLFDEGEERIETNLDIVKIIRTMRNQKIVVKQLLDQHLIKKMISQSSKVCINLDSEDDVDEADLDKTEDINFFRHFKD